MYQALASALHGVAWSLQSASQVVPISQLSIVSWVMFAISGFFDSKKAFKVPEQ
ncbi:MAG TPA: hypothetical protein VEJ19_07000 [Nitrososphaerales archaeon]|nr:hypothetical protein [Nitrososphaerales archaeon]